MRGLLVYLFIRFRLYFRRNFGGVGFFGFLISLLWYLVVGRVERSRGEKGIGFLILRMLDYSLNFVKVVKELFLLEF